jgi:hypothetical protein
MLDPELKAWIDRVIADTQAGKIPWNQANPTTYTWEMNQPRPARVVLQRIERVEQLVVGPGRIQQKRTTSHFVFQVFDLTKPNLPLLNLNGQEDPDVNEPLNRMYKAVANVESKETLEFLKSLLPQTPNS